MRYKTILKELDKILDLWKGNKEKKEKAIIKLVQLRNKIKLKVEEEEQKKLGRNPVAYNLAKWYYGLWNGQIPEGIFPRAVEVFKTLLEDFKLQEEEIKDLYSWWKDLDETQFDRKTQNQYSIVLTAKETRSITDFKGKLRYVRGLYNQTNQTQKSWTSPENERGLDFYINAANQEDDMGIPNVSDDDDEDVPNF